MKIICNTSTLSEACQNVQKAVSTKSALPTIEGILFKTGENCVELCGYDLEVGIKTSIDAKVEKQGSIIIPAKTLCDILRHLPFDKVSVEADERNICVIKSGDTQYSLIGISSEQYPEVPSVTGGSPISLSKNTLKDMIRQTIFAVSVDDSKVVHRGIKFEIKNSEVVLVALDGRRLALRREKVDYTGEDLSFVVPSKTLSEVIRLISDECKTVSITLGSKHIVFVVDNYIIVSRLLDGDFLDYKSAIPTVKSTTVRVNTKTLIDSIERAALIITEKFKSPLRCVFDEGVIKITSTTAIGTASDRIVANFDGKRVEIGFNNRFLLEALKACETDEVIIELNGPISPVNIVPLEGDSFLYLVLPVRLKDE